MRTLSPRKVRTPWRSGKDVLGGPVDRLDPLAQRRQVRGALGLVLSTGSEHRRVELGCLGFEVGPDIALVAENGECNSVVGGIRDRVCPAAFPAPLHGLARACALHRGGIDQQRIVMVAGAAGGEDGDQDLDRLGEVISSLVEARSQGQGREQVPEPLRGDLREALVGGHAHNRRRDARLNTGGMARRPTDDPHPEPSAMLTTPGRWTA
jgi:hypothetical protein